MATKSPEEKALTRVAVALRQSAYHARLSARDKAEEQAEAAAQASQEQADYTVAVAALDKLTAERNLRISALQEQIAQLQEEAEAVRREYLPKIEVAREARAAQLDRVGRVRNAERDKAREAFADLEDVYGAAQWKPLDEFLAIARTQEPKVKPKAKPSK